MRLLVRRKWNIMNCEAFTIKLFRLSSFIATYYVIFSGICLYYVRFDLALFCKSVKGFHWLSRWILTLSPLDNGHYYGFVWWLKYNLCFFLLTLELSFSSLIILGCNSVVFVGSNDFHLIPITWCNEDPGPSVGSFRSFVVRLHRASRAVEVIWSPVSSSRWTRPFSKLRDLQVNILYSF